MGTAIVFMVLAVPMGGWPTGSGAGAVFVGGYVLLLCVVRSLLVSSISACFALVLYLAAFGTFYAATDGVMMARPVRCCPRSCGRSGMGLLTAVVAASRLFGAIFFGALWTFGGVDVAVLAFAGDPRGRDRHGPRRGGAP